jgi:FkbM family methyltransferase
MHAALRSIGYGTRLRDKAVIAAHLATIAGFPLGIAARKAGRPLPDPRRWFGEYVVSGPAGVFACPPFPSPMFLGVDSSYEPGLSGVIEELDGGLFVDVGASVGFITVRAARRAEHVIAVEPHPVQFAFLERNVKLNGLTNVTCVNCALGATGGVISLYDVDPSLGPHPLHVSTQSGRGRRHDVPVRRLDDLVHDDVTMLKIDVEGDELQVLSGAQRVLGSRPRVVVESLGGENLAQLRELLPGYSFAEIDGNNFLATP